MARTPRTLRRRSSGKPRRPPDSESPRQELSFDTDERSARIGDPVDPAELRRALPLQREREAGMTGGEVPGNPGAHVTADDLAPETLYDEDGSGAPADYEPEEATDRALRVVEADEIGGGSGLDEAELARTDPLDHKAHRGAQP